MSDLYYITKYPMLGVTTVPKDRVEWSNFGGGCLFRRKGDPTFGTSAGQADVFEDLALAKANVRDKLARKAKGLEKQLAKIRHMMDHDIPVSEIVLHESEPE